MASAPDATIERVRMSFPSSSIPPPEEPQAPGEVSSLAVNRPDPALDTWTPAPPPPAEQAWRRSRRVGWELVQTLLLAFLIFEIGRGTRLNSSHRCISYAVFCLK